ncbi:MAG: host-nuclease inhibitor Gam family protein [Flavipsychrobacter sp.]
MSTRKSKKVAEVVTVSDYESSISVYANTTAKINQINADMEAKFTAIRDTYTQELAMLAAQQEEAFDTVQQYCETNKDTLFTDKKKSFETVFGVVGFRTGNWSLKTIAKGVTWDMVLKNLQSMKLKKYIRTKEEVDKETLLALRDDKKVSGKFAQIGIKAHQDEKFYIDLKEEGLPQE